MKLEASMHEVGQEDAPCPGQFLLGSGFGTLPPGWRERQVAGITLQHHPQLPVITAGDGEHALTLIGVLLDPDDPDSDDVSLLRRLLHGACEPAALAAATARFGGRWVLIGTTPRRRFLLHDALGLRQVFHTVAAPVQVMSEPGLGGSLLGLSPSQSAQRFVRSRPFSDNAEYRWPGTATPFSDIRHLLPNHWLDLDHGSTHRYWPTRALPRLSAEAATRRLVPLLTGLVDAAAARFPLALGLTAGLDSRLVLAASRRHAADLHFVTVHQQRMADDHDDLMVPGRLLDRLGLKHEILPARPMSDTFANRFRDHVFLPHAVYGPDAEAIYRRFQRRFAVVTGSGAEVGRCSFRNHMSVRRGRPITPYTLAHLQRMGREPFALRAFERWLANAGPRHGVPLLDLFEWEQGHGNWLAMTQQEFDIAWREIVTPYNCREVLTTLLAVPEAFRSAPQSPLFHRLIRQLWPEVLEEPVNPNKGGRGKLLRGMARRLRTLPGI